MMTVRHILKTEVLAIEAKARDTYGFDAFYSWFLNTYGNQLGDYELDNIYVHLPALIAVFEKNSTYVQMVRAYQKPAHCI